MKPGYSEGEGAAILSGAMDTDDSQAALEVLRHAARAAEPDASIFVHAVAKATGGSIERFGS